MKIEHVAFWVHDLENMKNFYIQYFGAKPSEKYHNPSKNFTSYFLTFDSGSRLELMHRPDILQNDFKNRTLGITHLAFSSGSKENVDSLTALLKQDGFQIIGEPRTTGDGYYESVILDPEGNSIEIME